ncbi:hypothetical protein M9H77_12756 [Catharanthus roseus]|uniref:Uncharacterized protein n=1 Tax=Catharanthus roseus TaxID=4058 RepID=A0ACC0BID7_CATRO|nr:hypothetical protein M9H77_12756 [Catharanthus roseus]
MSTDSHMPTQSHQEDPNLKKRKSSATTEQRVGDKLGEFNSPHHQRILTMCQPMVTKACQLNIVIQSMKRPQKDYLRQEAWHDDKFYEDYGDNYNVGQAYHGGYYGNQQGNKALDKINVVPKPQASTYKSWPKKEDTPKVAFQDHSQHKVEEKGKLITNLTRCFKYNSVGHIAISCPTKRTLIIMKM